MKKKEEVRREWLRLKEINGVLAYAASMVLTGVPPLVCESVLDEFYCSVRKSFERMRL